MRLPRRLESVFAAVAFAEAGVHEESRRGAASRA
jgi:hypothetical protein